MDRTNGLLLGGATLVAGALRQLEDDAVEMTRQQSGLRVRRRLGQSRRRAQDAAALLQLLLGAAILVQGLRSALREWSAVDTVKDVEGANVRTDSETIT